MWTSLDMMTVEVMIMSIGSMSKESTTSPHYNQICTCRSAHHLETPHILVNEALGLHPSPGWLGIGYHAVRGNHGQGAGQKGVSKAFSAGKPLLGLDTGERAGLSTPSRWEFPAIRTCAKVSS